MTKMPNSSKQESTKPVPTVGILVIEDNKVLLVKHSKDAGHLTDTYGLPAGHIGKDETEIESAIRELAEETGLKTTNEFLTPLPTTYRAIIKRKDGNIDMTLKVFKCKSFSGELTTSKETYPEWVEISKLSEIKLLPNIEAVIKEGLSL